MGPCPSKMMRSDFSTYTGTKVPDVIRNLAISHEPINIFRLLGFKDENVTAEEFKARVQERLKLLTVKKGGAITTEQKARVKDWLDNTILAANFGSITQAQVDSFFSSDLDIKDIKTLQEAVNQLKSDQAYRSVKLPSSSSGTPAECIKVQNWVFKDVSDAMAITQDELKKLGMSKVAVQVCMPKIGITKFGFAEESQTVKDTSTCKKFLEEALTLVDYRGKERFDAYVKLLKQRMSKETLMPKTALSESEFLNTCPEIEKKSIASFGFPPEVMGYTIIRENVDPFKFAGVKDTDDKPTIEARITALRELLKDVKKKEKKQTQYFKIACSKGLDEFQSILDKNLLDNLKKYISSKSSETKLYPESNLTDDEFKSYCMDDVKATPIEEPSPTKNTCILRRGDLVKKLGRDYGKIGTIKYVDDKCISATVEYKDGTSESSGVSNFKLLSRESCPFKVGDFVRNIKTDNVGVVAELTFMNENGEEQDKCISIVVNYDGGGQQNTDIKDVVNINWEVFFNNIKQKVIKGVKLGTTITGKAIKTGITTTGKVIGVTISATGVLLYTIATKTGNVLVRAKDIAISAFAPSPCLFKKENKVKRLGVGYGKIGTIIDIIKDEKNLCRSLSVKYEDNTVETDRPTFFKLLSTESCPFKVGDPVKNTKTNNIGVVTELNFMNENGEEQDKCLSVKVNYDSGVEEDTDIKDLVNIKWNLVFDKINQKIGDKIKNLSNRFRYVRYRIKQFLKGNSPIYGPEDAPNSKCFKDVKKWLDNVADKKNITVEELRNILESVTEEELDECLTYFDPNNTEINFAPVEESTELTPEDAKEMIENARKKYMNIKDANKSIKGADDSRLKNFITALEEVKEEIEIMIENRSFYEKAYGSDADSQIEIDKTNIDEIDKIIVKINKILQLPRSQGGNRKTYRKRKVQKKRSKLTIKKHNG